MADFLVDGNSLNTSMGQAGVVIASNGTRLFTSSRVLSPLRIMTSTDTGQTWTLLESIDVQNDSTECALFLDSSDNLHVAHRGNDPANPRELRYRRYDAPNYTLAVGPELAVPHGSVDSYSPLGILMTANGDVYVFYQMSIVPLPRYSLRYARRTAPDTWSIDNIIINSASGQGIAYTVFLTSADVIRLGTQYYLWGSSTDSDGNTYTVRTITGALVFSGNDATWRRQFWLAEVSGELRLYHSRANGAPNSADIGYQIASGDPTALFTASDASDSLLGIQRDSNGVHLFYGQGTQTPLLERQHLNSGAMSAERTELSTFNRVLGNADRLQIAYPQVIPSSFAGTAGVYEQPLGSTRFFNTLVATAAAGQEGAFAEPFLQEWGIGLEELMFVSSGARKGTRQREEEDL